MGKHDVPEEPSPSAPEWIVTFSDMISLLVTFFVMLMSFSTMEEDEAAFIIGAFGQNSGGIVESGPNSPAPPPPRDRMLATNPLRGADVPHSRPPEELSRNLEEMGQRQTDEHVEVDFASVADGLLITFDERASFAPGSDVVPPALAKSLTELGEVLQHYGHLVVVEGFTDDQVVPTPRHPTPESLSAARATAAAKVMLEGSRMSRDLLQVAGLGASSPRAANDSAADRTLNRRVQVRVLALSKARARMLQAQYQDAQGAQR